MCLGGSVVESCCGAVGDGAGPRSVSPALAVGVGERLMRGTPSSAVLCKAVFAGQHEAQALLRQHVAVSDPGCCSRAGAWG